MPYKTPDDYTPIINVASYDPLLLCLVGAFSLNNSPLDLWVLVGMGVVGYGFRKLSVDPAPLIVAVVLGPPLLAALGRRRAARA